MSKTLVNKGFGDGDDDDEEEQEEAGAQKAPPRLKSCMVGLRAGGASGTNSDPGSPSEMRPALKSALAGGRNKIAKSLETPGSGSMRARFTSEAAGTGSILDNASPVAGTPRDGGFSGGGATSGSDAPAKSAVKSAIKSVIKVGTTLLLVGWEQGGGAVSGSFLGWGDYTAALSTVVSAPWGSMNAK
jgi:hypothetical protein